MAKVSKRILKSEDVKFEGRIILDTVQQQSGTGPATGKTTSNKVQAHIVDNHPEFVVIAITCSCGTKAYLRCEYDNAKKTETADTDIPAVDEQAN